MPRIERDVETTVEPDRIRAALLDFTDRRPQVWPGIEPSLYEVYAVGDTEADVKEGSRMPGGEVWAREHYEWSDPDVVTWTVRESNFCAPGSFVSAAVRPRPGGGSRIHLVWSRTPTSMSGRIATGLIWLSRGQPVVASFRKALARLEAGSAA